MVSEFSPAEHPASWLDEHSRSISLLNQHNPTNADSSINTGTCLTQKLCFCTANMEERKCFYDVIDDIVCYKFAPNYTTADVQQ